MRFLFLTPLFIVFLSFAALAQSDQAAEASPNYCETTKCSAMVIAVSDYDRPLGSLTYSEQGARRVEDSLASSGFDVVSLYDPTRTEIINALFEFGTREDVDISLIYFVGNGGAFGDKKFIAPTDASFASDDEDETIGSLLSVTELYSAQPGTSLRINVMNTAFVPSSDTSKSLIPVPKNDDENYFDGVGSDVETLYLFSAQPGEPSFDSLAFPVALASALEQPGDLIRAFARLRDEVGVASRMAQFPELRMQGVQSRSICLITCIVETDTQSVSVAQQLKTLEDGVCEGEFSNEGVARGRLALLIGNNGYRTPAWSKLSEPVRDAETLSVALTSAGFQVRKCLNLGLDKLDDEILEFKKALSQQADDIPSDEGEPPTAFFYFSGHGAADSENGINYLIPTDSKAESADTLRGEAVSTERIIEGLNTTEARMIMVIDACRNALKYSIERSGSKGLVPFRRRPNLYIASATQPGEVASEKSGYAQYLADRIMASGPVYESEVDLVFRDVGQQVYVATNGKQRPMTEGYFNGRFYFQSAP